MNSFSNAMLAVLLLTPLNNKVPTAPRTGATSSPSLPSLVFASVPEIKMTNTFWTLFPQWQRCC